MIGVRPFSIHSMVAGQLLANGAGWAGWADLTVVFIFIKEIHERSIPPSSLRAEMRPEWVLGNTHLLARVVELGWAPMITDNHRELFLLRRKRRYDTIFPRIDKCL